ncbi:hypothetical protein GHO41_11615 [Pseudomonas sp. FSL R10-0399]|uniref:hypothetical protein n=1 Tax=Pseudomonas sp. FSL R10-0399 TaxID=2662194 RepID=UPI0012957CFC|nr:hypothetical protein [Pseudomonas sp. FSL R10-0399]MQT57989.1 hypothetical protein [Pseudomonas sp. FSL R10-0399]
MSAFNEQIQQSIESFDLTLVSGSVKKVMASIKAEYDTKIEKEEFKIKGAGGSSDLWKVPVSAIKVLPGFNVRLPSPELEEHIDYLTGSILEEGFNHTRPLAALVLEIDGVLGIYVYDGHCRLEGTKRAIIKGSTIQTLPVVVTDGKRVNLDDLYVMVHNLNKGKELAPFEIGLLCKRQWKNGIDEKTIARRMNIKPQYVEGLLRLVSAPKGLVDAVISNELSASEGIKMLRAHGNGKVVAELELMRKRAVAEQQSKALSNPEPAASAEQDGATKPAKIRLTARHASNAHVKKAVSKHGLALFQTARTIKADPAYDNLSETTRLALDKFMLLLDEAEKADATPVDTEEGNQGVQAAA